MVSMIDAHIHFWRYDAAEFPWIAPESALSADRLPGDVQADMAALGMDGCIAVQARQFESETDWLLQLASTHPWIVAVVGWCDIRAVDLGDRLDRWKAEGSLVGFRHLVQDEPDPAYLLDDRFIAGVRALIARGYSYDILVREAQRVHVAAFLERAGAGHFIVDHGAKPEIRSRQIEPWAAHMRLIAAHPTTWCKISGLPTEADHDHWGDEDILPYLDHLLEAFGPERLIFGSDWPVCTLAGSVQRSHALIDRFVKSRCPAHWSDIFCHNARRAYRLDDV